MPNHDDIYKQEAEQYHALIDKQPDLSGVIAEIRPFNGLAIVDLGAGTGRLTAVLAPDARSIVALDASDAMLRVAADRLRNAGLNNWTTKVADHRKLPLADESADLVVSGWSICYLTSTNVSEWECNLKEVISEIKRVLRPNGTVVIFETMGTGFETPNPPDFLKSYYETLVSEYGFSHRWIRTDYRFDDTRQAEQLTRFFFGDGIADRVRKEQLTQVPECAGIWWLQL